MLAHGVSLHRLEGPSPAAGVGWQAHLLYVECEDRELGGRQATYNKS